MMKILMLSAALLGAGAIQAQATVVRFSLSGDGVSGSGVFTIAPNVAPADPNPFCGTPGDHACRTDPPHADMITGITGTFSDLAAGISTVAITGITPIDPTNERDSTFDPLVPSSLSYFDLSPGTNGAFTYNNLFFEGGSPIDCDYPFTGTSLDVFGMAFTLNNGDTVNLWGNGNLPGVGPDYGVNVTDGVSFLDQEYNGVSLVATVPEPAAWLLMLSGFGGLGLALRRTRALKVRAGAAFA